MNRTVVIIALALSFVLVACGNKGDLYLEIDQAITDEIKQLDETLDELDEESDKKATKKAGPASQSDE